MKKKTPPTSAAASVPTIIDGGEMGGRIRSFDWGKTGIGPIDLWPQSLVTATNILLHSPVPIVMLWGEEGVMLYNDAYSVFAGQRHPGLLGSKVVEGWPEVADFNQNVMDNTYQNGTILSYKDQALTLYRNNTAEEVSMDLNYSPVIGEDGKPAGVWAIVVETSDRVRAERKQRSAEDALKSERERLYSLLMQAPALIAVVRGPDHTFEMANSLYIHTVAPSRDIIGKPIVEALPELKGQGIVEILDDVLRTGKPYIGELSVKLDPLGTGDLKEAYFNLVYQPISSISGGATDGILVHAVEITEQVTDRQRLEQLNAQLEAVLESMPDGLYIADTEKITRINQRGAEVLGYASPDEVPRDLEQLYRDLEVRYAGSGRKVTLQDSTLGNALRGIPVQHHGVRVVNPVTGKQQILRTAGAPIRDKNGAIIGGVAVNYDLTEQVELQEKVQKEALRHRLLSQKAKLLKERNDQLTRLNATKDEFIALTSHQLRTPATGVKQYLGMLMQGFAGDLTADQTEYLDRAYTSNERQLHIIEDILRVAKMDAGQVAITRQTHDLAQLILNIIDEQTDHFTKRQQQIITTMPDAPVPAPIDAEQLRMAISNIVDNAIKYTGDNKQIHISLTPDGNQSATLKIADQGVGIAAEDIDKLFQKFSRIPNSRSIAVGGTGLGLYWSRQLIELHGGAIAVTSAPGEGTTFTITLPLV